ncbi:hypothetical protein EMPS_06469 [Entomortierella parvispora]|uniref:Uncharacterized protein n=1 Tax=Entomortierella parvispora TaxID=205924 RepID=A0A9P3LX92_9FUNG|nr:hypothetical protein EMPS_06469 [Entomortierella parvispora]
MFLHKRAPPSTSPDQPEPTSHVAVIVGATVGSLALVMALSIFYCCMRKRRASRRIGQLQRFLPTFMDQEKTAKYFETQGSSSTLVPATAAKEGEQNQEKDASTSLSPPSNVHHRTRSAPIAFAKGVTDHRNRQLDREGSLGQFQQISLISEETVVEGEAPPRRSVSGGRTRATTVNNTPISIVTTTPPGAQVVSSLHRSVSLNKHHGPSSPIHSRAGPLEPEQPEEEEDHQEKFAEGESLVAPNRFSALLDFNDNRFSNLSTGSGGLDPDYMDPTRFSSQPIFFDAKRISNQSRSSSSDESVSSDEFNKNLPPHQQHHSFHTHDNGGVMSGEGGRSREASGAEYPASVAATAQSYYGDKQELEDDDQEFIPRRIVQPADNSTNGNYYGHVYYPPLTQQQQQLQQMMPQPMSMPMPMPMPLPTAAPRPINRAGVPLPESIRMSRPSSGSPNLMESGRQQGPRY